MKDWFIGLGTVMAALVAGLVALLVIGLIGVFGFGWFQRSTANYRGQTGVIERTKANPDFRIQAYEHFYDLCAAVQAVEGTLNASLTELAASTTANDQERIRTNITGLQAQRTRSLAQYNVDARKSGTQGQFRASDLPYQLPSGAFVKGDMTSCVA